MLRRSSLTWVHFVCNISYSKLHKNMKILKGSRIMVQLGNCITITVIIILTVLCICVGCKINV